MAPAAARQWLGRVCNWPSTGKINSSDAIWITIESWPRASAVRATVWYTTTSQTWRSVDMSKAGPAGSNDWWHLNLGKFPSGTAIRYAVQVIDGSGAVKWANNNGNDYSIRVN